MLSWIKQRKTVADNEKVNQDYVGHEDEQSVILWTKADGQQVRLTVSEFQGNLYLGIRYWLLGIDDEWFPTRAGFSIPYTLDTTARLFSALAEILSEAEVLHEVQLLADKAKDK